MNSTDKLRLLSKVSQEVISTILMDAIDSGNWHTPSVSNLELEEQSNACIRGKFITSLHNTYQDLPREFEITKDSVKIWEHRQQVGARGLKDKRDYRAIYNIIRIAKELEKIPFYGED